MANWSSQTFSLTFLENGNGYTENRRPVHEGRTGLRSNGRPARWQFGDSGMARRREILLRRRHGRLPPNRRDQAGFVGSRRLHGDRTGRHGGTHSLRLTISIRALASSLETRRRGGDAHRLGTFPFAPLAGIAPGSPWRPCELPGGFVPALMIERCQQIQAVRWIWPTIRDSSRRSGAVSRSLLSFGSR